MRTRHGVGAHRGNKVTRAALRNNSLLRDAATSLSLISWAPVFTNTTPTNVLFYSDPDAGSHPWRFYRAFQFP